MKLGISSRLEHSTPQDWAAKHKALGLECINFPVDFTAGEDVYMAYRKAADQAGLAIAEVGVWRNTLASDLNEREKWIQYAIGQLKMADRKRIHIQAQRKVLEHWHFTWRSPCHGNPEILRIRAMPQSVRQYLPDLDTFATICPINILREVTGGHVRRILAPDMFDSQGNFNESNPKCRILLQKLFKFHSIYFLANTHEIAGAYSIYEFLTDRKFR